MTQLQKAKAGKITPQMVAVADSEGLDPEFVRREVANGRLVIPANSGRNNQTVYGVGLGLSTKVNANIGTSADFSSLEDELEKVKTAIETGAHAVMDLSTGGEIKTIRQAIRQSCSVMLGTVPIYQAGQEAVDRNGSVLSLTAENIFEAIENHCAEGVDFITVHCGITARAVQVLKDQGRITNITSRGGSIMAAWMAAHGQENPLYHQYDRLLNIAKRHDVTLSLGDALRPGCIADGTDRAQVEELLTLGALVDRARVAGVQVMVEGPGHLALDQIETNIKLQKSICKEAPFYVLGPLVTDIGVGYDHITSAIGGALAAWAGADFLCYVTPTEHLALPNNEDVRQGVLASLIAAHAADIAKGHLKARQRNTAMAKARASLDWEAMANLSLDPMHFRQVRHNRHTTATGACSMCGHLCTYKMTDEYLK